MTQIGGAIGHPTTVIRDLRLGIGGTDITLPEVHLFSAPVGDDSSYGLSGADVFANAREVTIDFQGMRLIVRGRARPVVARSVNRVADFVSSSVAEEKKQPAVEIVCEAGPRYFSGGFIDCRTSMSACWLTVRLPSCGRSRSAISAMTAEKVTATTRMAIDRLVPTSPE